MVVHWEPVQLAEVFPVSSHTSRQRNDWSRQGVMWYEGEVSTMGPSTRSQKEQGTLLTPKRIVHWMILANN